MRYNEFKKPQLTEEQIVLDYCLGEITKEDAVLHLNEFNPLSAFNKLKGIGSKLYSKGKDFFGGAKAGATGATGQARNQAGQYAARGSAAQRGQNTGSAAAKAAPYVAGAGVGALASQALKTEPKTAAAAPGGADGSLNMDPIPKTGAAGDMVKQVKPVRSKVKATAANTRDYDKTLALQKKLIAGGAKIDADGLMGPKTRAAMKAAGMSTSTPGSKVKQPGPSVKQNPAYGQTGMDDVDMPNAKPKIRTDMPGGPTKVNAFKSVYNKATPAQKAAMVARLRKAQVDKAGEEIDAVPAPKIPGGKKKPVKKNFLGGDRPIFKVDDPKGNEVIARLPKWLGGGEVKTLPQDNDGPA